MCRALHALRRRRDTTSLSSLWAFAAAKLPNRCHLPEESGIGFGLSGAMNLAAYCKLVTWDLLGIKLLEWLLRGWDELFRIDSGPVDL